MDVVSAQEPIKIGLLFDIVFPPPDAWKLEEDFLAGLAMALDEALGAGMLDRPVELVRRTVEGLPRGNVKAVIGAWQELVDEGALLIIGPLISENAIALREHIERSDFVPSITWGGTEEWLGEWTFTLSDGSLSEEPFYIAQAGLRTIGVSCERSAIGSEYLGYLRQACEKEGLDIVATAPIAQSAETAVDVVAALSAASPDALVHVGFGFALVRINEALEHAGWDPPRFTTTAWENGYLNDYLFAAMRGWIGIEHYDEDNPVGQAVLDRFAERTGRRPEYAYPLYGYDMGNVVAHALSFAEPLSPTGVMQGLERVKMLPAACGSAGTRISYGKWRRNGWGGAGYLVGREVAPDLRSTVLRYRLGPPAARIQRQP